MNKLSKDEVMEAFRIRAGSGSANWEYAGSGTSYAYRLAFPDACFVIRGNLTGNHLILALDMMDGSGELLGIAAADSETPLYWVLSDIFLSARYEAGNPFIEELLESARHS